MHVIYTLPGVVVMFIDIIVDVDIILGVFVIADVGNVLSRGFSIS